MVIRYIRMRSPCIYDSIHMKRTHGPCVPTPLLLPFYRYECKNKHAEAGEVYSYFRQGVVLL